MRCIGVLMPYLIITLVNCSLSRQNSTKVLMSDLTKSNAFGY
jgi:hypothetical protein